MNESAVPTFWDRLAAKSQASGALASIEDPMTVVRIMSGRTLGTPNLSHPVGTISAMARIHVEGWAPEYGSPVQTDESLADEDRVDENVEHDRPTVTPL